LACEVDISFRPISIYACGEIEIGMNWASIIIKELLRLDWKDLSMQNIIL